MKALGFLTLLSLVAAALVSSPARAGDDLAQYKLHMEGMT